MSFSFWNIRMSFKAERYKKNTVEGVDSKIYHEGMLPLYTETLCSISGNLIV